MGPLGFVALFAAELLLGEALKALRPKPKPEKVKRPTAEEDTVIPVVFGTAVVRPNVIAWGDTSSEDVGDDKYAYYARMVLGLCEGPIDELVDLVVGGKSIALWTPTKSTSGDDEIVGTSSKLTYVSSTAFPIQRETFPTGVDFYVSALDLFGGRKGTKLIPGNNALGGVAGVVGVHWGTVGDPVDGLVTHLLGVNRASAFPGLAYLNLGGEPDVSWSFQLDDGRFYLGTTPNLPDFLVVVRAFPQALLGSADAARVGIDANPAEVVYQALTDPRRGMGVPVSEIDTAQLTTEAEGFASEGLGVSGQLEAPEQAIDLIDDICRATDSVVFLDPETSLISMKRMRQDYTLSDCLAISTSNCEDFSMTQPTSEQVTNEVRVQFRRYTGGVAGTVTGEAMSLVTTIIGLYGLFQLQGRNVSDLTIYDEDLDRTLTAGEFALRNPHLGIVFVTNNDDDNGTEIYNHNLTASYMAVPEDATFKDAVTPPEQDLANIELTGVVRSETIDAPFISNDITARLVAQRMLRKLSTPLAPATFSVSRQGHALKPGDVVRVTWPEYSLSDSPFRVSSVAWDDDPGGKIHCTAVADVFGTELQLIASDDGLASPGVDTPRTLTAPGINLSYIADSSIRVGLLPQDTSFTITLERADSGDFATGSTVLSSTITGTTTYYDDTVATGTPYYYRAFLHRLGYADGPYSAVLAATGVTGTPSTVVTAVLPTISEAATQNTLSGTLTLTITDPQARVTKVEFKTQAGLAAETAYTQDTATPYSATVAISTAGSSVITYRVTYVDAGGDSATIERAVGFNTPATNGAVVLWQADSRYPTGKVLTAGTNIELDTTSTPGEVVIDLNPDTLGTVGVTQATDEMTLWDGGATDFYELVGITTGYLMLEYVTTDDSGTFAAVDGTDGPKLSLQVAGTQRGAWVSPDAGFTGAADDVLLRLMAVDADGVATEISESMRRWKFPAGIQQVRIGSRVKQAGAFATDPQCRSFFVEFNAAGTTVDPPPDPDLPPDPGPIETTGLINLFDADEGVTDDGSGNIATWGNQATGSDLTGVTQTTGPVLYDDAGVNCVRFPGYFQFPSGAYTGRTEGHLFMLLRTFTLDHAASNSGFTDFGGNGDARYGWGTNLIMDYCTDAVKTAPRGSFDITAWHVLDVEANASTYIVRLNGTAILTTTNGTAVWNTIARLGVANVSGGINGNYLLKIMAEYSTPQSSDVAANVRNWLAFRGGFTL